MLKVCLSRGEAEKVERDLTKEIPTYQDPSRTRVYNFFREVTTDGVYILPRFYALKRYYPRVRVDTGMLKPSNGFVFTGNLRDEKSRPQKAVFNRVMETLREPQTPGATIVLTPGSGKTVIAIAIAASLGQRTLVLCHVEFLLNQWKARFMEFAKSKDQSKPLRIGIIRQSKCETKDCDVVLASVQSLASRDDYPSSSLEYGLVICDETHHVPCSTFWKALSKLRFYYSLGLTGTPNRTDGLGKFIFDLIGPIAFRHALPPNPSVQVSFVRYKAPASRQKEVYLRRVKNGPRRLNSASMLSALCLDPDRNSLILALLTRLQKLYPKRKGLLLSARVSHLQHLYSCLDPQDAALITGSIDSELTKSGKKKKRTGDIQFTKWVTLSTYSLFMEAVDFDGDFLILSTPKKMVEQAVGRILRGRNRNSRPMVVDILDCWSFFKSQSTHRRKLYERRGFEICDVDAELILPKK